MATIAHAQGDGTKLNAGRNSGLVTIKRTYDCASDGPLESADVVEMIKVPAGCHVKAVRLVVDTVEATATSVALDVGITGGDVDQYVDGLDPASLTSAFKSTLVGDTTNEVFTTADTIDVLVQAATGTVTECKFTVIAELVDLNS